MNQAFKDDAAPSANVTEESLYTVKTHADATADERRRQYIEKKEGIAKATLQHQRDCAICAVAGPSLFGAGSIAFKIARQFPSFEQGIVVFGFLCTTAAIVLGLALVGRALQMRFGEWRARPARPPDNPEVSSKKKDIRLVIALAMLFVILGQLAFEASKHFMYAGPGLPPLDVFGAICTISACILAAWAFLKSGEIWLS